MSTHLPQSKHFTLHQLTDGVYAAISIEGGGATSNAGIVDLGDRTLIFDTFLTPQAAEDLRDAATHLTGRPVSLVVNSHWHGDHIQGNCIFAPDVALIATGRTRELMATRADEDIDWTKVNAPAQLQSLMRQLEEEQNAAKRDDLALKVSESREVVETLWKLALRLPNETFNSRLTFHGTKRTAELLATDGGHTESDAFLLLPEDRLAFAGDLLFVQSHLWMGHGNPDTWIGTAAMVTTLDFQTVVPGHGPLGTKDDFETEITYIQALLKLAGEAISAGKTADQTAETPIPAEFADWRWREGFGWNMHFLHGYLSKQQQS
jgi:glyoxylase-like metal-dependent hydrolase (beta-lactamase superfamily II)